VVVRKPRWWYVLRSGGVECEPAIDPREVVRRPQISVTSPAAYVRVPRGKAPVTWRGDTYKNVPTSVFDLHARRKTQRRSTTFLCVGKRGPMSLPLLLPSLR
jgi:hypothetical protein